MLAPLPWGLAPPPLGNPGSATGKYQCTIVLCIHTTKGVSLLFSGVSISYCSVHLHYQWCKYQFTVVLCIYTTSGVSLLFCAFTLLMV